MRSKFLRFALLFAVIAMIAGVLLGCGGTPRPRR